jgi:prepilin-type N-terminal cleavage/methylation domain-containing protein
LVYFCVLENMKKNGFTLVELLVVIAVCGILILLSLLSLNGIQSKGRDAERMNDVNNLHKIMKIIKEETGSFQLACGGNNYQGLVSECQGEGDEFQLVKILDSISGLNDPLEKKIACDNRCGITPCNYNFINITEDSYEVRFWLERDTVNYKRGCHVLTERGVE